MKQSPWAWYVHIAGYRVKLGRCINPNLYFKMGPRYDFDFGFIYLWNILDRKWAYDNQSKRDMTFESWNA